jgi:hypothetical protein
MSERDKAWFLLDKRLIFAVIGDQKIVEKWMKVM